MTDLTYITLSPLEYYSFQYERYPTTVWHSGHLGVFSPGTGSWINLSQLAII